MELTRSAYQPLLWLVGGVLFLATSWHEPARAQGASGEPRLSAPFELIWESPDRKLAQDLTDPEDHPQPPFQFLEEDLGGTNPKIKVTDAKQRLWIVKWDEEIHSEAFASRFAAALGYFTRPTSFVREGIVRGVRDLDRAAPHVSREGRFRDAVFKLIPDDAPYAKRVNWAWTDNPFMDTPAGRRQLNGLKIVIMLTSNWDTKDTRDAARGPNTAVYRSTAKGQPVRYLYAMDDWGASLGRWGNFCTREKWDCEDYSKQTSKFIKGVSDEYIEWGFGGVHAKDITAGITTDDVRWLLQYLGRFSDQQIEAALRSSGANDHEVSCFGKAIRNRIRQLKTVVDNDASLSLAARQGDAK